MEDTKRLKEEKQELIEENEKLKIINDILLDLINVFVDETNEKMQLIQRISKKENGKSRQKRIS